MSSHLHPPRRASSAPLLYRRGPPGREPDVPTDPALPPNASTLPSLGLPGSVEYLLSQDFRRRSSLGERQQPQDSPPWVSPRSRAALAPRRISWRKPTAAGVGLPSSSKAILAGGPTISSSRSRSRTGSPLKSKNQSPWGKARFDFTRTQTTWPAVLRTHELRAP